MRKMEIRKKIQPYFLSRLPQFYIVLLLMSLPAYGQITADPNAHVSQQPQIFNPAQKVPIIYIQAPNQEGVSVNHYSEFDIPSQGAVLNNSPSDVISILAGKVSHNSALKEGTATLILNQVNAPIASQLKGLLEVVGDQASVVVANHSGISCDGCGFINTSHATLTTGKPIFSHSGLLEGYRVEGGIITFQGGGLHAKNTDHTDILARAVKVNAEIQGGNELRVITGRNMITKKDVIMIPGAFSLEDQDNKPEFALDVAAIGGMYADHIRMVGTEDGFGVRTVGPIIAHKGDVILDVHGPITARGKIEGAKNIQIKNKYPLEISNILLAKAGDVHVDSKGNLTLSGRVESKKNMTFNGKNVMAHKGSTLISNKVRLDANDTLAVNGMVKVREKLIAEGKHLDFSNSILKGQEILVTAHSGDVKIVDSKVTASRRFKIKAEKKVISDGSVISSPNVEIKARSLSNIGGKITNGNVKDNVSEEKIHFKRNILTVGEHDNTNGILFKKISEGISIKATGDIIILHGDISSNGDLYTKDVYKNKKKSSSTNAISLILNQQFNNTGGLVQTGGAFTFTGSGLVNKNGVIKARNKLNINTKNGHTR